MDFNQAREIDKIYKEVTKHKIKTRITFIEKIKLIELITGEKIKIQREPPMVIPLLQKTGGGYVKKLPNWFKGGKNEKYNHVGDYVVGNSGSHSIRL